MVDEYPFGGGISFFAMVYIKEKLSYFVIDGRAQIARFTNEAWHDAGQLNTARGVSVT